MSQTREVMDSFLKSQIAAVKKIADLPGRLELHVRESWAMYMDVDHTRYSDEQLIAELLKSIELRLITNRLSP